MRQSKFNLEKKNLCFIFIHLGFKTQEKRVNEIFVGQINSNVNGSNQQTSSIEP